MILTPALLLLALSAPDTTESKRPDRQWSGGALVDIAYGVNPNRPDTHVNRGAATAPRSNEVSLNYVAAYVMHTPSAEAPFVLQLALHAGANVEATYGGEPSGSFVGAETFKHLNLANAAVVSPWGRDTGFATTAGAGLVSSPITVGSYWSHQSWNYSSSWANSATPYYLMGAYVSQSFTDRFKLTGWLVNGWQVIGESNNAPSYMASAEVTPVRNLSIAEHFYFGPDREDLSVAAWRVNSDTQFVYDTARGGIAAYVDYGQERRTDLPGSEIQRWAGAALLGRVRVHDFRRATWELGLRPELWWESAGTFFGASEPLMGLSVTNGFELFGHVLARVEYRVDHSLSPDGFFYLGSVDPDAEVLAQTQHLIFFSLVGYFHRVFGVQGA